MKVSTGRAAGKVFDGERCGRALFSIRVAKVMSLLTRPRPRRRRDRWPCNDAAPSNSGAPADIVRLATSGRGAKTKGARYFTLHSGVPVGGGHEPVGRAKRRRRSRAISTLTLRQPELFEKQKLAEAGGGVSGGGWRPPPRGSEGAWPAGDRPRSSGAGAIPP